MPRPRLLDLFCCEGGAAAGYTRAGFDVHGYDRADVGARYLKSGAVRFVRGDATLADLAGYHAVHASPPCKDHTDLVALSGGDGTGWMLEHTIDRVRASGLPYVIENVPGAKALMDGAAMLCGSMFGLEVGGRVLRRHRLFLTSFALLSPPDQCAGRDIIGVYGTGGGGQMTRGHKATPAEARAVMGMPWASRNGCSQAIPPAFTEYLGEHLMEQVMARA